MKKILSILTMFLVIFSLVACNGLNNSEAEAEKTEEENKKTEEENKENQEENEKTEGEDKKTPDDWTEPTDKTTFEQYLDKYVNSFNAAVLDKNFGSIDNTVEEVGDMVLETLDSINIPATNVTFKTEGAAVSTGLNGVSGTLWQEKDTLYAYVSVDGEYEAVKLDIAQVEKLVSESLNQVEDSVASVKPSDAINMYLMQLGLDTTLDELLKNVEFDLNDFTDKGNGTYELKVETIGRLVEDLSEGAVSSEEVVEEIYDTFEKFVITFNYSNGKIRGFGLTIKVTEEDYMSLEESVEMNFSYGANGLNGISYSAVMTNDFVDYTDVALTVEGSFTNTGMSLDFSYTEESYYEGHLKLDESGLEARFNGEIEEAPVNVEVKFDSKKLYANMEVEIDDNEKGIITLDLELKNNWVDNGKLIVEVDSLSEETEGKLVANVTSGKIDIPSISEDEAEDLLELIMNSNKPNYPTDQPVVGHPTDEPVVEGEYDKLFAEALDRISNLDAYEIENGLKSLIEPEHIAKLNIPAVQAVVEAYDSQLGTDNAVATLWQEGQNIYIHTLASDTETLETINLLELASLVEQTKSEVSLDQILSNAFGCEISFAEALNLVELNFGDFEICGYGYYRLRPEAIARIVSNASHGEVSYEEALETLHGFNDLTVIFGYENGEIANFRISIDYNMNNAAAWLSLSAEKWEDSVSIYFDGCFENLVEGYAVKVNSNIDFCPDGYSMRFELGSNGVYMNLDISNEYICINLDLNDAYYNECLNGEIYFNDYVEGHLHYEMNDGENDHSRNININLLPEHYFDIPEVDYSNAENLLN